MTERKSLESERAELAKPAAPCCTHTITTGIAGIVISEVAPDHGGADAGVRAALEQTNQLLIDVMHDDEISMERVSKRFDQNIDAISHQPAPVAANASAPYESSETFQNCLGEMLRALGMSDAAQPRSPHEVFQSAIVEMKRQIANASAEARLREALANAITTLGQMCDGSNWPEFAQRGEGFRAYTHACEIAKTLADELFEEAAGTRPIPSVSCDTHSEQQRNTLGVTAGRDRLQSTHPHASDCDKRGER